MSYSHSEVAHRWVHGQFGKSGEVNGCNMHGDKVSMYSYNTVIAQALDREKDVWVVIDQNLTPSTGQHINHVDSAIPSYATVIRTHIRNTGYYYNDVNFIGWGREFSRDVRLEIATISVERVFYEYEYVTRGRTLETQYIDKSQFENINKLERIYGDCSLNDWLKHVTCKKTSFTKGEFVKVRKMVRMYLDGRSDEEITDALFGAGTWDAMLKRIAPLKKAEETRERMKAIAEHLFFWPKDEMWRRSTWRPVCHLTAKEIRRMAMREMLEGKFSNLEMIDRHNNNVRYGSPEVKAFRNARNFLGITLKNYSNDVQSVALPDGKLLYSASEILWRYSWDDARVEFRPDVEYKSFCAAPDKRKWRERFWLLCSLKRRRLVGQNIHDRLLYAERHGETIELTEEEAHIHNEFIIRMDRREEREAKQRRRDRMEQERRIQSQLEQMAIYREQGIDGMREMWRNHMGSVPYYILQSPNLCYGGNILLRFAKQPGVIETSKGIRLTFEECHRYWDIIQKWHDGGEFSHISMHGYQVRSFADDILVAGCHEIAYCEMQRMYEEMLKAEAA